MNRIGTSAWCIVMTCVACAAFTACAGVQSQRVIPAQSIQQTAAEAPLGFIHQQSRSWMSPQAAKQDLVYVSDAGDDDVKVYGLTHHQLLGTLAGIKQPWGVCADPKGYVWVVAYGTNEIIEYAHAGTTPIQILKTQNTDLYDCAVDPTTGNLAVTNWGPNNWFHGDVLVFPHGSGTPKAFYGRSLWFYFGCTYDDQGNLFADGWGWYLGGYFTLAELPKGARSFKHIVLSPDMEPPLLGTVRWDGKYVAIGDWKSVNQYAIKGNAGYRRGNIQLTNHWPVGFFAVTRTGVRKIIAPDTAGDPGAVQYWKYPQGGNPSYTIKQGRWGPFAAAVSLAQ
jgi:hypothetical protein